MARVVLTIEGQADFAALPLRMQSRVRGVLARLAEWPNVSGAKPLRGDRVGQFRIRSGDWRVLFRVISPDVIVVSIKHRSEVYEQ